ncbi:type I restriction endonuclease [Streptomyces pini]|uniref:type I site-specific deoxyribonuclease n=1 Tax=Streptomyces pini TaxID=1520580 RepID=A0A1I3U1F7_9ACTN|nr:type I restriction endonuclease subunit R [Streptomyces pini]SFJ76369.1 type I restriction enzyme, R subunit [Streptomyces pini]
MGWTRHECPGDDEGFGPCRECLLAAVDRLNPGADGTCWLTDTQLEAVWAAVGGAGRPERVEVANIRLSRLLRTGIPAQNLPDWHDGLPGLVRLVDWEDPTPGNNDFRLAAERGIDGTAALDLVLRVNGLPWVVIVHEPDMPGVVDYLIHRILDLAGVGRGSVPARPGLARCAQLLVVMDGTDARLGTITSSAREFAAWRTVVPATEEQVRAELGCVVERPLQSWEALTAGVLRPSHLLGLVRNFFHEEEWGAFADEDRTAVKTVARYPQYRAVHRVTDILTDRLGAPADDATASRAGLVWNFEDSGTEQTLGFLIRRLRTHAQLADHMIVVVTHRREREWQLINALKMDEVRVIRPQAWSTTRALALGTPDVITLTTQKLAAVRTLTGDPYPGPEETAPPVTVNTQSNILVIVDEANRVTAQHARLRELLPNAAFIGFADTPADRRSQAVAMHLFGGLVDVYTARDALTDGVLTPVLYEPASALDYGKAEAGDLMASAPDQMSGAGGEDLSTRAARMFRYWAFTGLRHGVAAQVVASSRADADRYCAALRDARDQLLVEIDDLDPDLLSDPAAEDYATEEQRAMLGLWAHRHVLARIDPRASITVNAMDPPEWQRWAERRRWGSDPIGLAEAVAERQPDPSWGADPHDAATPRTSSAAGSHEPTSGAPTRNARALTVFTVVRSRLEEVDNSWNGHLVFLDRGISAAALWQIMRARRPGDPIHRVVDHADAIPGLERAFARYDADHLRDVLGFEEAPYRDLCKDREQAVAETLWRVHREIREFLNSHGSAEGTVRGTSYGIDALRTESQREDLLAALADPLTHARFIGLVRRFLTALNSAPPAKAEPVYAEFAGWLGVVQYVAWKRHRPDSRYFVPRASGAHVDDLVERWLEETRTRYLVPPERMTAPDFLERVSANADPRARIAYLLAALWAQLTDRPLANPLRQRRFENRLAAILRVANVGADASGTKRTAEALLVLARDILAAERDHTQATSVLALTPVQRVLVLLKHAVSGQRQPDGTARVAVRDAAMAVTSQIVSEARSPHFGRQPTARNRLRKELRQVLEEQLGLDWDATGPLAVRLVELAVERREEFIRHASDSAGAGNADKAGNTDVTGSSDGAGTAGAVVLPWPGVAGPAGTNA